MKSRILVENACSLIGVVDTEGILKEGEVYVQTCPDSTENSKMIPTVITGKVVVTRSPCLHPGDIRLLTAVDRPQLKHLMNVIVFSSEGI